jgi:hypothetical protein
MAATTLAAILAAWDLVLQAAPLSLVPAIGPFTHDQQPNATIADSYYVTDGGTITRTSATNDVEVRVDRLQVWIAKPLTFGAGAAAAQLQAMADLGDDLYRYLVVAARTAGYNVEADTRRISAAKDSELLIANFDFRVDYDFDAAVP